MIDTSYMRNQHTYIHAHAYEHMAWTCMMYMLTRRQES